jgi:hypothetical protein
MNMRPTSKSHYDLLGIELLTIRYQEYPGPWISEKGCDLRKTGKYNSVIKLGYVPIGVVSKNNTGERKTPPNAALNIFRLATKLASLTHIQ